MASRAPSPAPATASPAKGCGGCYVAEGRVKACYRWYWREPCPCVRCLNRARLEREGQSVEPCGKCGEPIYFARGAGGGRVPVSARTGESHFKNCPAAASFSRGRAS